MKYIEAEEYSTKANAEFKEANISDLVFTITPIITYTDIRCKTGRNIQLS